MGRKQRQASRKARSRADAKPGRAKKDRPDVDLVRRSGFEMQDEALEQALLSGEQAPCGRVVDGHRLRSFVALTPPCARPVRADSAGTISSSLESRL